MLVLISGATAAIRRRTAEERRHIGHLLNPRSGNSISYLCSTGLPIAADNDCFQGLNRMEYIAMLTKLAQIPRDRLLWVVAPDVVADAQATLARFAMWRRALDYLGLPIAFVAQDGQESLPVPWDAIRCLFIGGSTAWKEGIHAARLAREAQRHGKWVHMGRVNTLRRARLASALDVDSIDGSSLSRFSEKYVPWMVRNIAMKQHGMEDLLCGF